jgi:acetyl-CoA carboxylase biotin carboxylase subunit
MNFEPSPGTVTHFHLPGGLGVRVDSALQENCEISLFYDSLIAKLTVWGRSREESILRMRSALEELSVDGIKTTASFLRKIIDHKEYLHGNIHTSFADDLLEKFRNEEANMHEDVAVLSAALAVYFSSRQKGTAVIPSKKKRTFSLWKAAGRMNNFSGRELKWIR